MYPSFPQFSRWAAQYRALPLWIEPELPDVPFLEWVHSLQQNGTDFFCLQSAAAAGPQGRYSYFSLEKPICRLESLSSELRLHYEAQEGPPHEALKIGNPIERFGEWFQHLSGPRVDGLPPFWGGAVGYFGYGSAQHLDPAMGQVLRARRARSTGQPLLAQETFPEFSFNLYDMVAIVDHALRRLWIVHTVILPEGRLASPIALEKMSRSGQDRLRRAAVRLQKALRRPAPWGPFQAEEIRSSQSASAYQLMVRRAKGHIVAGDIYQCNLSQSFSTTWEGDPWTLYRRLTAINPSPYAALWRQGKRWIVSASPELLLRQQADQVETRPIAGTYPREGAPDDETLKSLVSDAKERAEHIMLVDLERNDLGRICRPSTVRVAEALTVETYSHVLHLVSGIRGQLLPGLTWRDVLRACFPGGTITGCPKIRCMEIIQALETVRRGPYCGSMGWIGFQGDMTLNILIRSLFLDGSRLSFPAGAGIVADSSPLREYQETQHKAKALLQALQADQPARGGRRPPAR